MSVLRRVVLADGFEPKIPARFVRIDYAPLAVQWLVGAALVGVAMVVTGTRRRAES